MQSTTLYLVVAPGRGPGWLGEIGVLAEWPCPWPSCTCAQVHMYTRILAHIECWARAHWEPCFSLILLSV